MSTSNLTAVVTNGVLVVEGQAASSLSYNTVKVTVKGNGVTEVLDNGSIAVTVPIIGDIASIKSVDLSGIVGAGASFFSNGASFSSVYGTVYNDSITPYYSERAIIRAGDGNDSIYLNKQARVYGEAGNDTVVSYYSSRDLMSGGAGDDDLRAGGGDDRLNGGRGNDWLDGGDGIDIAVFTGNRSDYLLSIQDDVYVIEDLRSRGSEGTDTLGNIEKLQFADGVFDVAELSLELSHISTETYGFWYV